MTEAQFSHKSQHKTNIKKWFRLFIFEGLSLYDIQTVIDILFEPTPTHLFLLLLLNSSKREFIQRSKFNSIKFRNSSQVLYAICFASIVIEFIDWLEINFGMAENMTHETWVKRKQIIHSDYLLDHGRSMNIKKYEILHEEKRLS